MNKSKFFFFFSSSQILLQFSFDENDENEKYFPIIREKSVRSNRTD